jgi:hypothetical protein
LIGGAVGAPPEIPAESFVTINRSKQGANGYVIVSELLLRCCPWGDWEFLCENRTRLATSLNQEENRIVIRLDPAGDRVAGRMPGWISQDRLVGALLEDGLVPGRHPARWEKAAGQWVLVAYPRVVRR